VIGTAAVLPVVDLELPIHELSVWIDTSGNVPNPFIMR
jgi:hypothetical protein